MFLRLYMQKESVEIARITISVSATVRGIMLWLGPARRWKKKTSVTMKSDGYFHMLLSILFLFYFYEKSKCSLLFQTYLFLDASLLCEYLKSNTKILRWNFPFNSAKLCHYFKKWWPMDQIWAHVFISNV